MSALAGRWHSDVARHHLIAALSMCTTRGLGMRQTRPFRLYKDSRTRWGAFPFSQLAQGIDEQSRGQVHAIPVRHDLLRRARTHRSSAEAVSRVEVVALDAPVPASLNDRLSQCSHGSIGVHGYRSFYKTVKLVTLHRRIRPTTPEWSSMTSVKTHRAQQRRVRTTNWFRAFSSVERSAWTNKVFPLNDSLVTWNRRRPLRSTDGTRYGFWPAAD